MSDDISLINLNTDTIEFLLNKMKIKIYLEILNFINTEDNYLYFTHLFIYFFKEFKDLHKIFYIFYIAEIINNTPLAYQEFNNEVVNLNRNSSTFKTLKTLKKEINEINEIINKNDIIKIDIQSYLNDNLDKLDYNIFILLCDIISDKRKLTIDKVIHIISKYVNIKELYQKFLYNKIREDDKYNQYKYHKDLIHVYMYTYNLITNNNLITKKEYLRVIKIILKCIFLTNYIDINYSYAMTCINIYLYKMHELSVNNNNNNNKALIILALLARLLLQTNTFYLNNYTNYLQIQTSNIRYTNKNIDIEKIKEIIEYQQTEDDDENYDSFISNIQYVLKTYYNIDTHDIIENDMKQFIYIINKNINNFNNLKQLILLILVLKYISINIDERYKNLQEQIITFIENIKIYVIMNNGIEDKIKNNINEIYSTLNELLYSELCVYINSNNLSDSFINIINTHYINTYFVNIDIIHNDVIIKLHNEDDMNKFKILYYLIKIIDIIDINNYSLTNFISIYKNIFDKIALTKFKQLRLTFYNNYCKNYPEKISYINNYNIKGGDDDINDKIQLLETNEYKFTLKDPTYLLNHIPMFNCKRIILIRFITTELTSKKIKNK